MKHLRAIGLALIVAGNAALAGCGNAPTVPRPTPGPVPPAMTSLTLSGNNALTGIGQTSRLTATGHYADGSTKDVSASTIWSTGAPSVVTVSPDGTVTTIGLGAVTIGARRQPFFESVLLTVTPPGTLGVSGRTREPGAESLAGVHVVETSSGLAIDSQLTGEYTGYFALGGLTNGHLTFTKESYEDAQFDVTASDFISVPLQRIIRIAAGDSVFGQIAPHDMDYLVAADTHCGPCKLIRVTGAGPTLSFRVSWTDRTEMFSVWINGQRFLGNAVTHEVIGDATVGPGEVLVYVAMAPADLLDNHVAFTFSTTR